MSDWLDSYATELEQRLRDGVGFTHVAVEARNSLLELAAIVAHGTQRRNAPLATYLAGAYVARRAAQGADELEALEEALNTAKSLLPSEG